MELQNILIFCAICLTSVCAQKKVVCYWYAGVDASQINPQICTHITYSFLGLDNDGSLTYLGRSEDQALGFIRSLVGLRSQNPNLKVLVSIGGYNDYLLPIWSNIAANSDLRNNLASNVLSFLQINDLNGVDIDWEFPNFNDDARQDVQNFILLLKTLKETLNSDLSVSIALGTGKWRTDLSYDIPSVFDSVDFVNVMAYDLHGRWNDKTGIHGALYPSPLDPTDANVDYCVNLLLNQGVAKEKLIMGIPCYGITFKLIDPSQNGVGAPAVGDGSMTFPEICSALSTGELEYRYDDDQKVPYAFGGSKWVGFEDVKSVTEKANYIRNLDLGGAMFWAIDSDDSYNFCGQGNFPLISTVYNIVANK